VSPAVPQIFDSRRRAVRRHRASKRQSRDGAAHWLGDAMAEDVIERLGFVRFEGHDALVAGLARDNVASHLTGAGVTARTASGLDFEQPLSGGPYDTIISLAELDTVNDLPGALIHLRHALAPGGLLLATLVGAGSLPALRRAMLAADGERPAARIHPQVDNRAASALLERAGFSRQVVDHYPLTVRYGSLAQLVADLRDQGLGSVLADRAPALTKASWQQAEAAFREQADPDGKTPERFEILTITGWKD
jgi:SAM-dependent methyltransferase